MATLQDVLAYNAENGTYDHEYDETALTVYYENSATYFANEDADDIVSSFEDAYMGRYDSWDDFVRETAKEMVPELNESDESLLVRHFDYDAYGADLLAEGSFWYEHVDLGMVAVFMAT